MLNKIIRYFIDNQLVTFLLILLLVGWGLVTSPFRWDIDFLPADPVSVDAIPDIGENQQIVFTEWKGRSPQDIEDQITYPLTTSLLGISGVKSVRSSSVFGFSSIYIIFDEEVDFYWSRSRILEKLNALPVDLLPKGVQPSLGADATALGQVFWYTLEGRDKDGNPTGGWDLHEIRTVQDFYVKYGLNAVDGVAEVASIGGHFQEYQVVVNPDLLKTYGIPLHKVANAVRNTNRDVGAKTIEINQAEYLVRGLGYVQSVEDLEETVVDVKENTPIRIRDIGQAILTPATRRGLLDKDGAEVVGGVVVARYGANPMQVIENVKQKIKEISTGLPKKILSNGTESQLTLVPFYDRTQLIYETLGTLEEALSLEILITVIVVIVMVFNLRASLLISSLLPIAVLMVFISMRYFDIDANIVALSGIAIAIGTMVDLGIVLSENMLKKLKEDRDLSNYKAIKEAIYEGASEVSSAIVTAVATTIVSFVPVFTMQMAEGKLFRPLAFTKTFALVASLVVALLILPTLASVLFGIKTKFSKATQFDIFSKLPFSGEKLRKGSIVLGLLWIGWLLAQYWMPLGGEYPTFINFVFVLLLIGLVLVFFLLLERYYPLVLNWCLENKKTFLLLPSSLMLFGLVCWLGFNSLFGGVATGFEKLNINIRTTTLWSSLTHTFPSMGKEFMPSLDEGSFLLMPTSMPHAGISENKRVVQQLDMLVANIPEVELVVGKMGRVNSALDPAPIGMYENVINYKSEYLTDDKGRRKRFKVNQKGAFILSSGDTLSNEQFLQQDISVEKLIPDSNGKYFRNWRNKIQSPNDIWNEIVKVTKLAGVTSAPKLQPIETRLVMLQTGMRAPMGIKVYGADLETIEAFGLQLEGILKEIPSVKKEAVFADRIVGKPYIHLNINRQAIGRYGLTIEDVQQTIETAIGGMTITSTVEGRQRFPISVRYPRELRDSPEALANIYIPTPTGVQVPLGELVEIEYVKGAQMIKSEDTFLVGYVLFDKMEGYSDITVVEHAQNLIQERINNGILKVPTGISYKFSGNYENQVRAEKRLAIIIPLVLLIIFLILYFQFKSITTTLMVFSGVAMAFSGAFILLWLYGESWFFNVDMFGVNMRDLFQIKTIHLSVAVWVGFIALFGIATDDGVLIGTYLDQSFQQNKPTSVKAIREAVLQAGKKRIRPAIMTSATTLIALLPVLTSSGRGADIMIPMAIPAFGGMLVASITYFIVPVLYALREEKRIIKQ